MRTSVLLTGALALLVSATPPQLFERAYQDGCKNALIHCPRAKSECFSLLRATITPSEKTVTTTITSQHTTTKSVTSTVVIVTHTITETAATSTVTTQGELHASSTVQITQQPKRDVIPRGLSPKVTKIPEYARGHCKDAKAYASACSAIGVKPTITALPAHTVKYTKTVSTTITATATLSATKTVTTTTTTSIIATVTALGSYCQPGWMYVDGQGNAEVQRTGTGPNDFEYDFNANSFEQFALTDDNGMSGYLVTSAVDGTSLLAYTHTSTVAKLYDVDVDILDFTTDYTNETLHTLTCQQHEIGQSSMQEYTCASTARSIGVRDQVFWCQWPTGVKLPPLAIGPSDHTSEYCTPIHLKTMSCQQR